MPVEEDDHMKRWKGRLCSISTMWRVKARRRRLEADCVAAPACGSSAQRMEQERLRLERERVEAEQLERE